MDRWACAGFDRRRNVSVGSGPYSTIFNKVQTIVFFISDIASESCADFLLYSICGETKGTFTHQLEY